MLLIKNKLDKITLSPGKISIIFEILIYSGIVFGSNDKNPSIFIKYVLSSTNYT